MVDSPAFFKGALMQRDLDYLMLAWGAVLFWMVWLCASVAEPATWNDVMATVKVVEAGNPGGCIAWVEEYSPGSMRVWQRCTSRGTNGIKKNINAERFTGGPYTLDANLCQGVQNACYSCNGTGEQEGLAAGKVIYGTCQGKGAGQVRTENTGIDCLGVMSSNPGSYTPTSACAYTPFCAGTSSTTAVNCAAMDVLVQDFGPVSPGECTVTSGSIDRSGKYIIGWASCNCTPDRMRPTGYNSSNPSGTRCQYSAAGFGDPVSTSNGMPWPTSGVAAQPGNINCQPSEGCGGASGGGGGDVPTVPGTGGSGGTGQTPGASVPVSGGGAGGSVVVSGTGSGGSVTVSGTGAEGGVKVDAPSVKTPVKEAVKEAIEETQTGTPGPMPDDPGGYATEVDSLKGQEEYDWTDLWHTFVSAVPLVEAVTNSGIQPSSQLCKVDGSIWGHTVSFDFCPLESVFQLLGTFVVGIAALYSTLILTGRA